jgi:glyceraldehyde-3-phosphate dehydrogenase/erythrose-4-phosphate dehydrogenase
MSVRVGINGFGRIGRLALRAAWDWPELARTVASGLAEEERAAVPVSPPDG